MLADLRGAPSIVLTSTAALGDMEADLVACGARAFVAKDRLVDADLPRLFGPAAVT